MSFVLLVDEDGNEVGTLDQPFVRWKQGDTVEHHGSLLRVLQAIEGRRKTDPEGVVALVVERADASLADTSITA
jgi:hypothetical protein